MDFILCVFDHLKKFFSLIRCFLPLKFPFVKVWLFIARQPLKVGLNIQLFRTGVKMRIVTFLLSLINEYPNEHALTDDCKRRVEVIVSSYHGANAFREELVHGFILVYSTKRKASLATLRAFSANIPNLPIQVQAVFYW